MQPRDIPTVHLIRTRDGETPQSHAEKAIRLYKKAGFNKQIEAKLPGGKARLVAIKQHFGEENNEGYLRPPIAKAFADVIKKHGASPFLFDTTTLYRCQRSNAIDHLNLCREHGFTPDATGCPLVIGDGLVGASSVMVPVKGQHFKEVPVADAAYHAYAIVVLTHVTGHPETGLGGSIKNIAMGCTSRAGKMSQHCGMTPSINKELCTACGRCEKWCPAGAITVKKIATINTKKCIGCGQCLAVCPFGAVGVPSNQTPPGLQERMVEHCLGTALIHPDKMCYFNFVTHITKGCDCFNTKQKVLCPDIGILASDDPLAIDQASADIVKNELGRDFFAELWADVDYRFQLEHAERVGLGSRKYRLVEVS